MQPAGTALEGLRVPGPAWLLGFHTVTSGGTTGLRSGSIHALVRDAATGRVALN